LLPWQVNISQPGRWFLFDLQTKFLVTYPVNFFVT